MSTEESSALKKRSFSYRTIPVGSRLGTGGSKSLHHFAEMGAARCDQESLEPFRSIAISFQSSNTDFANGRTPLPKFPRHNPASASRVRRVSSAASQRAAVNLVVLIFIYEREHRPNDIRRIRIRPSLSPAYRRTLFKDALRAF